MNRISRIRGLRLSPGRKSTGLYVHMPFCASKCRYCDFNSYAGLGWLFSRYVAALKQEVVRWPGVAGGGSLRPRLGTVYFGGGTPTLIGAPRLISILDAARLAFAVSADAEITVETNPGVADAKDLDALISAGVNRLSMGVQSFDEAELRLLGRIHTSAQVKYTWLAARHSGFRNVSLDLMYGLPGQTTSGWGKNLSRALELEPEHISLYSLTIEEGTPLARSIACRLIAEPDSDVAAEMYQVAEDVLGAAGYHHYEISNWSKPGSECLHNLNYWRNGDYVGVGAGAHAHIGDFRLSNCKHPLKYAGLIDAGPRSTLSFRRKPESSSPAEREPGFRIKSGMTWVERQNRFSGHIERTGETVSDKVIGALSRKGLAVDFVEAIDKRTAMAETMMLGLRLDEGVDGDVFRERFGHSLEEVYGLQIEELRGDGLLALEGGVLRLTSRGRLLGNQVFCRFV